MKKLCVPALPQTCQEDNGEWAGSSVVLSFMGNLPFVGVLLVSVWLCLPGLSPNIGWFWIHRSCLQLTTVNKSHFASHTALEKKSKTGLPRKNSELLDLFFKNKMIYFKPACLRQVENDRAAHLQIRRELVASLFQTSLFILMWSRESSLWSWVEHPPLKSKRW